MSVVFCCCFMFCCLTPPDSWTASLVDFGRSVDSGASLVELGPTPSNMEVVMHSPPRSALRSWTHAFLVLFRTNVVRMETVPQAKKQVGPCATVPRCGREITLRPQGGEERQDDAYAQAPPAELMELEALPTSLKNSQASAHASLIPDGVARRSKSCESGATPVCPGHRGNWVRCWKVRPC